MSPTKTTRKAVTPSSVKVLMLVEAGIIGFLSYWMTSEYFYNAYFRTYLDDTLLSHITTYTAIFGLGIGLAGSAVAATFYRNMRRATRRLETLAVPKIKGIAEKVLSGLPAVDQTATPGVGKTAPVPQPTTEQASPPTTAIVPVPQPGENKSSD